MIAQEHLLDDQAMSHFITNGYIQLQADLPAVFHREIYQHLETLLAEEANPGNNILPRIPAIQQIFENPTICGALTSILGAGYIMHPHRYCHLRTPGNEPQDWHKDDYVFDHNVRHHRFRWVMAFYYPQDVTVDMGPTGLLPGRQFYNHVSAIDPEQTTEPALSLCGKAGTVTLVNFDTWHRGMANISDKKRYMLKFQFLRMQDPREPCWNHENPRLQALPAAANPALPKAVWNWLCGDAASSAPHGGTTGELPPSGNGSTTQLAATLGHAAEDLRLDAAYALGTRGEAAVPALIEALRQESAAMAEQNLEKTPANVQGGNPADLYSAHALTAVGGPAVPDLIKALGDESGWVRATAADILGNIGPDAGEAGPALAHALGDDDAWVRRNTAEALGYLGSGAAQAAPALQEALQDPGEWVRLNSALALARIGPPASRAVPALLRTLDDQNRYTRFFAATALQKIATPEAQRAVLDFLSTSRWCPLTTKDSPY